MEATSMSPPRASQPGSSHALGPGLRTLRPHRSQRGHLSKRAWGNKPGLPPAPGRAPVVKEKLTRGERPAPGPSKALLSPSLWSPWKKVRRMSAGPSRASQKTSEETLLQSSKAARTARRTSCCGRYGGQFTTRYVRCRLCHLLPAGRDGLSATGGAGPPGLIPLPLPCCASRGQIQPLPSFTPRRGSPRMGFRGGKAKAPLKTGGARGKGWGGC